MFYLMYYIAKPPTYNHIIAWVASHESLGRHLILALLVIAIDRFSLDVMTTV